MDIGWRRRRRQYDARRRRGGSANQSGIANGAYTIVWNWDTLAGGSALKLASASTAAAGNAQKMLEIALSGLNANSTQTTYGAYITNAHSGVASTDYGLYAITSGGATANYGVYGNASGASSSNAYGVYGTASGNGSIIYGVYGNATGIGSVGGYFTNGGGGNAIEANGKVKVDTFAAASATTVCQNANVLSTCSSSIRYKEKVKDAPFGLKSC